MTRSLCRRQLAMLRMTAPDCWSAGIGGSGEWRGPPATGEARETVDYRPCLGPFSPGDPATRRRPRAARAGDTGLSPPAWSHRVAKQWASASTAQYSKRSNVTSPEQGVRPPWLVTADDRPQDSLRHVSTTAQSNGTHGIALLPICLPTRPPGSWSACRGDEGRQAPSLL